MPKLGVNIDHIATLRQLRYSITPDIVSAAMLCQKAGADSIVVHLREDRRHIQDADVVSLKRSVIRKLNLEMSIALEIVRIACRIKPDQATFVPEKRQELTTEGGLDVIKFASRISNAAQTLKKHGIDVSLFIEPDKGQIRKASEIGVGIIELHTGCYANSQSKKSFRKNLEEIKDAVAYAHGLGLVVNAGHGLDYDNVGPIAHIPYVNELNIGYSIVCHSVFVGIEKAVRQMKGLVQGR